MKEKILLVDDDERLRKLVEEYLTGYGYEVISLPDGLTALETIENSRPDIAVLDIMMPEMDGLDLLRQIRTTHPLPVIMLTAKGDEADRIVGLELGADDYLPKPFNPRELLARIKAVLRRSDQQQTPDKPEAAQITAGGLILDTGRHALIAEDREIELSVTEYKIMEAIMSRPNIVFSRDRLLNLARGRDTVAFDRAVDVHISNLRTKLKPFARFRKSIKTVWGAGYMFVAE